MLDFKSPSANYPMDTEGCHWTVYIETVRRLLDGILEQKRQIYFPYLTLFPCLHNSFNGGNFPSKKHDNSCS